MKFFNTAGPVNRPQHYKVDPLHRWNLDEILSLIDQEKYFILHAPRQTGKTSSMLALQDYLNQEGKYFALYANFEMGQASRNDVKSALKAIVTELLNNMRLLLNSDFDYQSGLELFSQVEAENGLNAILTYISESVDKPVVLMIDEIDSLVGDTLISVLRQLRAGYTKRPLSFPSSVILCGVRDIKDYRIHTSGQDIITGGSAFNIKAESLRLGNFSKEDVINLYSQHTTETGQKFEESCYDLIMDYTDGQPWLVNALAYEVTYNIKENRDPTVTITPQLLEIARERLILSRQTHLDQLADKLKEDRVRRVILPMITGDQTKTDKDDKEYCLDLGLIKKTDEGFEIANQIYKEILPRELSSEHQDNFLSMFRPVWINPDGSINVKTLLTLFKDFWNENTGIWGSNIAGYQEAAPQLITQAFLQRVANGKGFISREYGLSRKRTDLMLKWQYEKEGQLVIQNVVMELKIIHQKLNYQKVLNEAIIQTANYAKICGVKQANILIFDRDKSQNWSADEANEVIEHDGISLEIWKLGNSEW
ncbi:MAG TPA: AAA-like domain-containing protein [Candidatus Cloacimonadota bacterium]|nr:AAA-like domain-containing protein [Candidatus Cloacimonadota bacterium]